MATSTSMLDGERMRGEWMLIRLKFRSREKRENWLLRTVQDEAAGATDALAEEVLTSVATGRTMAGIVEVWPTKRVSGHVIGQGEALLEQMCRDGLEGVASKRADAPYRSGRTRAWTKVKCLHRDVYAIVGWLPSDKRRAFRSLLLGREAEGDLVYAGKVGTGFDATAMAART